jgi:hypothetical protein
MKLKINRQENVNSKIQRQAVTQNAKRLTWTPDAISDHSSIIVKMHHREKISWQILEERN